MHEGFKSILVTIDFSSLSLHYAEEAAIIAEKFNSDLHLLYISKKSSFQNLLTTWANFFHISQVENINSQEIKFGLERLKSELVNRFGIRIQTHETSGSFTEIVNEHIHKLQIELVVIGLKKKPAFKDFVFESIAGITINPLETEVLYVHPESNFSKLKKIVIPVGKSIPKRKILLAYILARKFASRVYLISALKSKLRLPTDDNRMLMKAYQYLKDITNMPVECITLKGNNIAETAILFAKNIEADLILINNGKESRLPWTILKNRGSDIVNHSPVPVMSVHSAMGKI